MDSSTFENTISALIPNFLYFDKCKFLGSDRDGFPVFSNICIGVPNTDSSPAAFPDNSNIYISPEVYAEFKSQTKFISVQMFDDVTAELDSWKNRLDRRYISKDMQDSLKDFQRLIATLLQRLSGIVNLKCSVTDSRRELAALTDQRAYVVEQLNDLLRYLSLYRQEFEKYLDATKRYDAQCLTANFDVLRKMKLRQPSLDNCLKVLNNVFGAWTKNVHSSPVTEKPLSSPITPGKVEIVPSKAKLPAKSSSKKGGTSMATSFVVHRHVVSIKDSSRLKHNSYLAAALSSSPSQSSAPISTALRASTARLPSSTPQLSTQSPPSSPRPVDGILPTPCMPLPPRAPTSSILPTPTCKPSAPAYGRAPRAPPNFYASSSSPQHFIPHPLAHLLAPLLLAYCSAPPFSTPVSSGPFHLPVMV